MPSAYNPQLKLKSYKTATWSNLKTTNAQGNLTTSIPYIILIWNSLGGLFCFYNQDD